MSKKNRFSQIFGGVLVGIVAITGFSIIFMKQSGYWPCEIIQMLTGTSC